MKKVKYVIGAVGAWPALALMIPAATAANAATPEAANANAATRLAAQNAPRAAGKTVAVDQDKIPLINCAKAHQKITLSTHANLSGSIWYSGTLCIARQGAFLYKRQTGLTERVRFYSGGGALERTTWQAGNLGTGSTSFWSDPNMYAHKVCQALVANSNHNNVKYGPVCETA
jgi:hypothetical protein